MISTLYNNVLNNMTDNCPDTESPKIKLRTIETIQIKINNMYILIKETEGYFLFHNDSFYSRRVKLNFTISTW